MTSTVALIVVALSVIVSGALPAAAAPTDASLLTAARSGDIAAVRAQLAQSVDIDARTVDGMSALHWAVRHDSVEMTKLLIAAGADVGATNRYGVTPLTLASTNGNEPIVSQLLAAGADPNTRLEGGETVLMTAARTGRVEVIYTLLSAGADPNARDEVRGQTALMWAAAENNTAAVSALIAGGAAVSARTGDLTTEDTGGVFSRAVGLTKSADSGPSFTALLFAVQRGQLEVTRALLAAGADVNDAFPDGTSALVLAAMNGQFDLSVFLIDQGADVNAAEQGWNALHQTIRLRRTNIGHMPPPEGRGTMSSMVLIHKLLAAGVEVNAPMTADFRDGYRNRLNRFGATPFLLASKNVDTQGHARTARRRR